MKRFLPLFFSFIFLLFSASEIKAQVVINEVSPTTDQEWVKFYNMSPDSVNLRNYVIYFDDNSSTTQKKQFCDTEFIAGNSYKLVVSPGGGSSWLANTGDTLILKKGDLIIDTITYGSGQALAAPSSTQSIKREPDGSNNWIVFDAPSQMGEVVSFNCPTPSPTAEATATTNATAVSTPTPAPTAVVTPTPTPTPVKTSSPKAISSQEPQVLGQETGSSSTTELLGLRDLLSTSKPAEDNNSSEKKRFPLVALVFIVAGGISIGLAVFLVLKKHSLTREGDDIIPK